MTAAARCSALLWLVASSTACGAEPASEPGDVGSDESGEGVPAEMGQVSFRFRVGGTVPGSNNLEDELTGTIYGNLFSSSEVTLTGPIDGAVMYGAVEVPGVDLTESGAVSDVIWTSDDLAPGEYVFLGFFDVDESSVDEDDEDPEDGDPVTLPNVNVFPVEAGETTEFTISFDLVVG